MVVEAASGEACVEVCVEVFAGVSLEAVAFEVASVGAVASAEVGATFPAKICMPTTTVPTNKGNQAWLLASVVQDFKLAVEGWVSPIPPLVRLPETGIMLLASLLPNPTNRSWFET